MTEPALRRVIGVGGLSAAIFNITVGAAIFVLPAHVAGGLGAAAPLAYLVCAVATALVAHCIAEAGSRVPQSGGPYAYVGTALGPFAGYLCGVLLWLGITLAMGAVSTVFADAVAGLAPGLGGRVPRAVLLIAVITSLAIVNIRGAALGSQGAQPTVDDMKKVLQPMVELDRDLRTHLVTRGCTQKYWVSDFTDYILDRVLQPTANVPAENN